MTGWQKTDKRCQSKQYTRRHLVEIRDHETGIRALHAMIGPKTLRVREEFLFKGSRLARSYVTSDEGNSLISFTISSKGT